MTLLCMAAAALGSCRRSEPPARTATPTQPVVAAATSAADVPFRVIRIDLGKGVDRNQRIIGPTLTFQRYDVIYASVVTEGRAPEVALKARWTFGSGDGELVHEAVQMISASGPAATEFHILKQNGWALGQYRIAVIVGGQTLSSAAYTVTE